MGEDETHYPKIPLLRAIKIKNQEENEIEGGNPRSVGAVAAADEEE